MRYLFLYLVLPAAAAFLAQSILCRRIKKGIMRYGGLMFTFIFLTLGIAALPVAWGGAFGGLGVIEAALWFVSAACSAIGYGGAWGVFFISKKAENGKQKSSSIFGRK